MLTLTQKTLVQESFATIAPIADDAAVLFYRRLFEMDPSLQGMFRGDMAEQRKKLMQMLTAAVKGLDRLDQLVPVVKELGRRHAGYGVADVITTRSAGRCSGRSRWGWARRSRPRRGKPGRRSTGCSRRR